MLRPAIFLDKDGTLIEDVPYNVDPALVRLAPGAREAAALFREAGYALVVISNQAGVAQGYFPEEALGAVWTRLEELLGVKFDGVYYCPHHPAGKLEPYRQACECRKPGPGMLLRAARELDLDLARSWMVGDILNDVEAGSRAGCRTALVLSGGETEWVGGEYRSPTVTARDMAEVARAILRDVPAEGVPG